jgi:hypothetical protein
LLNKQKYLWMLLFWTFTPCGRLRQEVTPKRW